VAGGRLLRELDRRRVAHGGIFTALTVASTFALAALSAYATNAIGLHALFGAFLAGTVVPRDNGLARDIVSRLQWGVGTLLLPAFFAFSGLRTDLGLLSAATAWMQFAVVLGAAIVGKLGGAAISARITGSSWHESLGIGILMNTRGLMELVVLNVALELGIFSPMIFSIMVAMALLTTLMTSPLLALLQRVPFSAAARIRA
jgi:Kef-type K+ transport system membrane component KefB